MATFTAAEKKQIWKFFKLPPEQLTDSTSVFNCLITNFEILDTNNGDIFIPDIQADLVTIATDQGTLATLQQGGPIQVFEAEDEGRVEFVKGTSTITTLKGKIDSMIKDITDQIDPRGFLNQFALCAKSIPTT